MENKRSIGNDRRLLEYPQWMRGSLDRGAVPRSYEEIDTTLYNLQEIPKYYDNLITGKGVKMGEFVYASLGDFKDEVLKDIPQEGFGIFVDAWSLCVFFNVDYTSDYLFLFRVKKFRGLVFKTPGEARVDSTFDQRYPDLI